MSHPSHSNDQANDKVCSTLKERKGIDFMTQWENVTHHSQEWINGDFHGDKLPEKHF